jgi:class 3 adenylate cyclase
MDDFADAFVRYLYLDIVGFSNSRSVEAQSSIVASLNAIVRHALERHAVPGDQAILLPTGDGLCIALIEMRNPYDLHLRIALDILSSLATHNAKIIRQELARRFEVRIGLNENVDSVYTDINGNRNVAGMGVTLAQRIMDAADGGQILCGVGVYETLRVRERYMGKFRQYRAIAKHGEHIAVYQYVAPGATGLNTDVPRRFVQDEAPKPRLSLFAAYYLAHALRLGPLVLPRLQAGAPGTAGGGMMLAYSLAHDSEALATARPYETPHVATWGDAKASLEQQLEYYERVEAGIQLLFRRFVYDALAPFHECFADTGSRHTLVVNAQGIRRLQTEWPLIWSELDLDGDSGRPPKPEGER